MTYEVRLWMGFIIKFNMLNAFSTPSNQIFNPIYNQKD